MPHEHHKQDSIGTACLVLALVGALLCAGYYLRQQDHELQAASACADGAVPRREPIADWHVAFDACLVAAQDDQ